MDWLDTLRARLRSGSENEVDSAAVRVTVAAVRGSAPREPGACMLVGKDWQDGTIGGGHLELMATGIARNMLTETANASARLDRFPLGATLGQCCGGVVELWFERYSSSSLSLLDATIAMRETGNPVVLATSLSPMQTAHRHLLGAEAIGAHAVASMLLGEGTGAVRAVLKRDMNSDGPVDILYERVDERKMALWLFGAGHVGKALVETLAGLPVKITWIDSRDSIFPMQIPRDVRVLQPDVPADAVADAPAGAMFLIMTHSHDMDFEICRALLDRGDFAWAGLIGSKTKAARFVHRLRERGFSSDKITSITCPIGIDGISSKLPAAIAIAVAAQVLQVTESLHAARAHNESTFQVKP